MHDSSYKFLFSSSWTGFINPSVALWFHPRHFETTGTVLQTPSCMVGGDWVYLYLLIEFQSSVDKYMALRMMVYIGLLYQDLIKRGDVLVDGRLPPILPIVLYNGNQRWTPVTDVADLIPVVPGLVEQFKPGLKYLLIDENAYSEAELASLHNLVGCF